MSKKLLIVDDHEIIRLGLRLMLENTDLEIAAEATTAAEALAASRKVGSGRRPDGHSDGRWRRIECTGSHEARSPGSSDRVVLGL